MSHTMISTDEQTLFDLNAAYVNAYMTRDAAWYDARLVEDFIRIGTDAIGTWRRANGAAGRTRYIDSYARLGGEWKCVCAQLTAMAAA